MSKPAWLHAIALVMSLAVGADAAWGQTGPQIPRELSPRQQQRQEEARLKQEAWLKVIEPWVKAGGVFGLMWVETRWQSQEIRFREAGIHTQPHLGEFPSLLFKDPAVSNLTMLPTIDRPFGLKFSRADQSVLKAIAKRQQLKILDLSQTAVTDAELQMLSGLRLQSLAGGPAAKTDLGLKYHLALLEAAPERLILSSWTRLSDAGLKQLEQLAGLARPWELDLSRTSVTDAGLRSLSALSQLQSLKLGRTRITDAGLKALTGLKQLRWLDLSQTAVTDAGLKELTGLKQLRSLNLGGTAVTDVGLQEIAKLSQLESLELWETKVTDAGVISLTRLRRLRSLNLYKTAITDAGLKDLERLKLDKLFRPSPHGATPSAAPPQQAIAKTSDRAMIEAWVQAGGSFGWMRLDEKSRGFSDASFRAGSVDKLTDGHASEIPAFLFKDPAASRLAALPISEKPFGLRLLNADEAVLKAIARQRQLKILDLRQTAITDAQLTALTGLRLSYLAVGGAAKTDLGLKRYLALLEAVPTGLDLSGWKGLTDAGLKELTVQPKLQALNLSSTAVTDAGLKSLSTFSELKSLNLDRTAVRGEGLASFPQLLQLSLWESQVTDDGLKSLAGLTRLHSLNLVGTRVTDAGLDSLRGLAELRTLNLGFTQVTDEGLKKLADLPLTYLRKPDRPRQQDDPTKRCVGDACKAVSFLPPAYVPGSGGACLMMANRGDKPVTVELMIGGRAKIPVLPGKDTHVGTSGGCIRTVQQLGPYRATYTEVVPSQGKD